MTTENPWDIAAGIMIGTFIIILSMLAALCFLSASTLQMAGRFLQGK